MRLDDEAVRVAIGLRLGLELCVPHKCHCGTQVDAFGRQTFVCRKAAGRSIRHHALNELVARALSSAAIPNTKEPQGLCRSDGKRPDGLTVVPWQSGRSLVWDVTVVCPLADCCVASAAREARSVAELAATKKEDNILVLQQTTFFRQLRSRLSAELMSRYMTFSHFWSRKLVTIPATSERQFFFVPARFRASTAIQQRAATQFLCLRTARSNGDSDIFF